MEGTEMPKKTKSPEPPAEGPPPLVPPPSKPERKGRPSFRDRIAAGNEAITLMVPKAVADVLDKTCAPWFRTRNRTETFIRLVNDAELRIRRGQYLYYQQELNLDASKQTRLFKDRDPYERVVYVTPQEPLTRDPTATARELGRLRATQRCDALLLQGKELPWVVEKFDLRWFEDTYGPGGTDNMVLQGFRAGFLDRLKEIRDDEIRREVGAPANDLPGSAAPSLDPHAFADKARDWGYRYGTQKMRFTERRLRKVLTEDELIGGMTDQDSYAYVEHMGEAYPRASHPLKKSADVAMLEGMRAAHKESIKSFEEDRSIAQQERARRAEEKKAKAAAEPKPAKAPPTEQETREVENAQAWGILRGGMMFGKAPRKERESDAQVVPGAGCVAAFWKETKVDPKKLGADHRTELLRAMSEGYRQGWAKIRAAKTEPAKHAPIKMTAVEARDLATDLGKQKGHALIDAIVASKGKLTNDDILVPKVTQTDLDKLAADFTPERWPTDAMHQSKIVSAFKNGVERGVRERSTAVRQQQNRDSLAGAPIKTKVPEEVKGQLDAHRGVLSDKDRARAVEIVTGEAEEFRRQASEANHKVTRQVAYVAFLKVYGKVRKEFPTLERELDLNANREVWAAWEDGVASVVAQEHRVG